MTNQKNERALLLGIDFGTARTAVMSSRRHKGLLQTVVGYPRDVIGVKLLNRTLVVGDEAIEKRSFLDLYHPVADGLLKEANDKDWDAAREILQQAIALSEPRAGERICGIIGVPARATATNRRQLLQLTEGLLDLCLVVSEPFMVAYGLSRLLNTMIVDVGAGTIDLCAMKGSVPAADSQLSILKGGNYIDRLLETAIRDAYAGVQIDRYLARQLKEQHAFVGAPTEAVLVHLRVHGKPMALDVTEAMRMTCETIVPDIVEAIKSLLLSFAPECQAEALANIVLAGGGSRIRGLGALLEQHLREYGDVHVTMVADPEYGGAYGALKLAMELPTDYWSQIGEVIGD
ncbi:MamK family actin-like protein [Candidatus Magnetaquicoccus inordinatus]|uniref:MamK family actin-like protein n=1 Tax=Candidatus Magnetaquicoccus inordinatus TaxID=2496818 RepID=UPI00102BD97B|nr:MamK family actin-like protein [Candidatus Magnetaquicoccus inordinatus]